MAAIFMEAEPRTDSGKGPNRRLRASGRIPGVLYGGKKEAVPVALDPKAIIAIIRSHGGVNTIFELGVKGAKGKENVMIREYQLEPIEHKLLHADLVRVAMDKELTLDVAIELTGTAVGVKVSGGMMDFVTRAVEISCLPKDIPETIVADVSHLELGQYLRASELQLPPGVKLVSEANVVIAHCVAPKAEEEEKPAEAAAVEGAAAAPGAVPAEGAPKAEAKEGKDKPKEGKGKD
ncbi:MAG TPA: 50S ribosomal protein L25 [Vicinamibacteria bacterium]|nr:50S ribosomal protein L25 [Vicinamibacteria bacterium]